MFWGSKSGISSKYSYSNTPTFTAEPWSVYTGKPKSSSSSNSSGPIDKVSVFIFDKKQFESYLLHYGIIKSKNSSHDKLFLNDAYTVLRNQVNNLAKFKHPNILQLIEPLEEHSKNFLFVTEYVSGSLFNLFQEQDSVTSTFGEELLQSNDANNLTIQRGILQVCQALDFIHNKTSSVHLDIQPRSVFVNENADWKLSGLGHLIKLPEGTNVGDFTIPQYDPRVPTFLQIDLNFAAPELVMEDTFSARSDYFSLGLLIYYLYYGKSLFLCENSKQSYRDQFTKFERKIASLSWDAVFQKVPQTLRFCLPRLMNRDIYSRYDNIVEFLDNDFFKDPLIQTLIFLDDLPTKNIDEKTIFLTGLITLLPKYPTQLLQKKFLPILLNNLDLLCSMKEIADECLQINLEVILLIGKNLSQLSFTEKITNHIIGSANGKVILEHGTSELIKHLSILQIKLKKDVFDKSLLKPLYEYTCESQENPNIQEGLLNQLPIALETFDFATVKNFLSPLIQKLFTKTTSLTVKNACISCFQTMIQSNAMDTYMIQETLFPLIKSMKSRDSRILMKFLEFFPHLYTAIQDKEELITESFIPLMFAFSMAPTLNTSQYNTYSNSFNSIVSQIQKRHVQQLKTEQSKSQELESKDFTKIIDTPIVPVRTDTDNEISRSINVPVIKPKASHSYQATGILTPTNNGNRTTTGTIRTGGPSRGVPRSIRSPPQKPVKPTQPITTSDIPVSLPPKSPSVPTSIPASPSPSLSLPPGFGIALQPNKKA
ncbi:Scy1 [Kluyveromyces lactis]|nr:Scy1 [Kluyveromyces lactis]